MPIYSSLYSNFVRQGSTFAKSITAHGYAQSVVAATHPHVLNSQNRPVFGRRHTKRQNRLSAFHLHPAFLNERSHSTLADHRHVFKHGGLDDYFEALQQKEADGEVGEEWTQFEFPKRLEWKPDSEEVIASQDAANATSEGAVTQITPEDQAVLAHIDAALVKEIEARRFLDEDDIVLTPRRVSPTATPTVDPQSQSYADYLFKLTASGRYAEIPAVFEAMLATGVQPIAGAYNALLTAAIHVPTQKTEVVSKALDVYADMLRRRISPDSETYDILVGLLASRSLEVSGLKSTLEDKRRRFGGMDEPDKFMFASHEFEYAILGEEDRLDLAMKLFESSADAGVAQYSAETYCQLISACAQSGRVADMLSLFGHMEESRTPPYAVVFPTMIKAYAKAGDLISAVECYNEYRSLAVANDNGETTLQSRMDADVYASVINAYVVSDKIEGAMKFFKKIVDQYGVRVSDIKDALVSNGFVQGFISRGILQEALYWAQSVGTQTRNKALSKIASTAADADDQMTATEAFESITSPVQTLATPAMAMLAMSVRAGDVASATKFWHVLSNPEVQANASFIEPATMYAVALIGSGQVAEGLSQADTMFQRIRATEHEAQLAEEIEEGLDFITRYMESRNITDPRQTPSPVSSAPQQTFTASPFLSTPTVSSFDDNFDPHAHSTDFKGSSMIADDLEGGHGRKGPRLGDALNRFRNMRRAGRHPRYITYAKLITASAKEGKMDLCQEILAMARSDVPLMPQYAAVRYGWSSILDAMVGACLTMGNRGRAEQYHQELLEMGASPSANTFGLYITTLKESTKTFDEASEAVRIFHRAKSENVEPSSFLYNALIGKLGKARRIDDCLFFFAEMRALGIKPTSVTYGTIVNALCRVSDEKFAEELFDEMEAMPNYKPRPAPYNSMMQFFLTTKRDKSKVLAYYERMKNKGIAPTSHTFKLLVDTYATLEPIDMVAAEGVLNEIAATGQQAEPVHYASLIHARGCAMHDLPGAQKIFDAVLQQSRISVNASMYQAMFEAMVANHEVSQTEALLKQMRQARVELTPYIANTLIHGWAAEKNINKAQAVYDAVPREKREPSTYEAMTRAFLATEQREQANAVVGEMLTRGYPSAVVNKVLELLGGGNQEQTSQ